MKVYSTPVKEIMAKHLAIEVGVMAKTYADTIEIEKLQKKIFNLKSKKLKYDRKIRAAQEQLEALAVASHYLKMEAF